jgi:hypothetical protein
MILRVSFSVFEQSDQPRRHHNVECRTMPHRVLSVRGKASGTGEILQGTGFDYAAFLRRAGVGTSMTIG